MTINTIKHPMEATPELHKQKPKHFNAGVCYDNIINPHKYFIGNANHQSCSKHEYKTQILFTKYQSAMKISKIA